MDRAAIVFLASAAGWLALAGGFPDAMAGTGTPVMMGQQAGEFSAQARRDRRRPRIIIERQPAAWTYPRPGTYSWPGPGAVRQCVDWYALEHRLSGTVLTPQMSCRWVRG